MASPWQEFIDYLNEPPDLEYGDFKRRTDLHLRNLVAETPINSEQAKEIAKLRDDLIWHDHPDEEIDNIREHLRQKILKIATLH